MDKKNFVGVGVVLRDSCTGRGLPRVIYSERFTKASNENKELDFTERFTPNIRYDIFAVIIAGWQNPPLNIVQRPFLPKSAEL